MTIRDPAWSRSDGVVRLRAPEPDDAAKLIAGRDAERERWLGPGDDNPHPTAAIVVNDEVVGWVDADPTAAHVEPGEVNVGYNFFAHHRQRGFASRAVELLIEHLADEGIHRVARLSIDRDNTASLGVARRARFTPAGPPDARSLDFTRPIPAPRASTTTARVGPPILMVISGPIAAGKTTAAGALAERLRSQDRAVAIVDPDDIVETLGGFRTITPARWQQARSVHGLTVGAWLDQGIDVIAPGPFYDDEENATLLRHVPATIRTHRALVEVPYEVAASRVTADDATRGLSRDLGFLRRAYDRYERLRDTLPAQEWTWDTTLTDAEEIAEVLASALSGTR